MPEPPCGGPTVFSHVAAGVSLWRKQGPEANGLRGRGERLEVVY